MKKFLLLLSVIGYCETHSMYTMVNILGLDKKAVLKAFNVARPPRRGCSYYDLRYELAYDPRHKLTDKVINQLPEKEDWLFYYIGGRFMNVYLSGNSFDSRSFDCNNGQNSAKNAIKKLRKSTR